LVSFKFEDAAPAWPVTESLETIKTISTEASEDAEHGIKKLNPREQGTGKEETPT
jgi:hypothetical protein